MLTAVFVSVVELFQRLIHWSLLTKYKATVSTFLIRLISDFYVLAET